MKHVVLVTLLASACVPAPSGSVSGPGGDADTRIDYTYQPTLPGVAGSACAFTQGGWGSECHGENVGCTRDRWFDVVYPNGLTVEAGGVVWTFRSSAEVAAFLPQGGPVKRGAHSTFFGQVVALTLNLDFSNAGVFGADADLAAARLTSGRYTAYTPADLLTAARLATLSEVTGDLIDALDTFNNGFHSCDPADFDDPDEVDGDDDGVTADADCDDADPHIGVELYHSAFYADDGYLGTSSALPDPWFYDGEYVSNTEGGQQALIGAAETWGDTVTFAAVDADGALRGQGQDTDRFRAGILARATLDDDQDEGFHGYRCAVALNTDTCCATEGPFVQLASFLDATEDDNLSEYSGSCDNPTFEQLDRAERSDVTRVLEGDRAELAFWTVGSELVCQFRGIDGEEVTARAVDDTFASGTTGLSVLNAYASFDHLRVCEAFATP